MSSEIRKQTDGMDGPPAGTDLTEKFALFEELPKEMAAAADWKLKMADGALVPCHSMCLCAVSPVLAFTLKTTNKNVHIPVPTAVSRGAILAFLRWIYRVKYGLIPETAYELSMLCDAWNIQGEAGSRKVKVKDPDIAWKSDRASWKAAEASIFRSQRKSSSLSAQELLAK